MPKVSCSLSCNNTAGCSFPDVLTSAEGCLVLFITDTVFISILSINVDQSGVFAVLTSASDAAKGLFPLLFEHFLSSFYSYSCTSLTVHVQIFII